MQNIRAASILSLGCIVSSIIFSLAFFYARSGSDQYISVKGLSEREVDANVGIWTIDFEVVGGDLNHLNTEMNKQTEILVSFLKKQGFLKEDIVYGVPQLIDRSRHADNGSINIMYSMEMRLIVNSPNVFLIHETMQKSQELIKMGVQLASKRSWKDPVEFIFTNLNEIKPSMIQEATINAKKAADQLVSDANIHLGALRTAEQGTFSIQDTYIPTKKRVRIVTYMKYAINN